MSVSCLSQLFYEPYQGRLSDDTGVNGLEVKCRGPGMYGTQAVNIEQKMGFSDSQWSPWSSTCLPGTAVCALKTKLEIGGWDNGAVTNAQLYCCEY